MTDRRAGQPLFFATSLSTANVARLAAGLEAALDVDSVEFAEDAGGDVSRELGVPLLAGMDEIDVEEASFSIGVSPTPDPRDTTYTAKPESHGQGVIIALPGPGRLVKAAINYDTPQSPPATVRGVVRPATPAGDEFTPNPPIYASPSFPSPGPMFPPALDGLRTIAIEGGGQLLTMPPTDGPAWLIQIATASDKDGPAKLSPLEIVPTVTEVQVDAVPSNLTVSLVTDEGDVTLWSQPGLFLRGVAPLPVSFLPMARKHLSAQLKKATGPALSVPLKFHSDSASRLEVTSKRLTVTYRVRPFGSNPVTLRLGGSWQPLSLSAPAGLASLGGSVDLTAKLQPRALNAGSPEPPLAPFGGGLRATPATIVATAMPFSPLPGTPPGTVLPLASARALVEAAADSELVLELRADAAGVPGGILAGPVVKQLKKNFSDWLEFTIDPPLPVSTGGAPVWVTLRLNRGEIRWFADPGQTNPTRLSGDQGQTWAEAEAPLVSQGAPLTQLFHALGDPLPAPAIQL
ncbi:MAG TPA: hypothetical protein VFZ25_03950, partial [Chloroflexota bacterium]|nr:hypothetical protein [Chloroflexota bacterium]